jgi:endo-beta-N-acetylglucosaminidase D
MNIMTLKRMHRTIIGTSAIIFITSVVCALMFANESARFRRTYRKMDTALQILLVKKPKEVSLARWEDAVRWTNNACSNVCFSPAHIDLPEFQRFCDELNQKVKGKVDLDTLKWIWSRLASTGSHGRNYVARNKGNFDDVMNIKEQ